MPGWKPPPDLAANFIVHNAGQQHVHHTSKHISRAFGPIPMDNFRAFQLEPLGGVELVRRVAYLTFDPFKGR